MTGDVTVGLVTALPIECAAARRIIDHVSDFRAVGDLNHYCVGTVPSRDPHLPHRVVVALQAGDGTRNAAALCTDMARSFPNLRVFLVSGIAAGVPVTVGRPGVRLGDLVVATAGVVDYAHIRAVDGASTLRKQVDGLSMRLLRADRELQIAEAQGIEPWRASLARLQRDNRRFVRPDDGRSVVHRGAIGSADVLLRDALMRDELAIRHGLCGFEMEASGVAVGADLHERHWFIVRGISDHADNATKNDDWHGYAAAVAAAYSRSLLEACAAFGVDARDATEWRPDLTRHSAGTGSADRLEIIVETLLGLRQFRDDYQRREVIDQLPGYIRTAISDNTVGRLHVLSIIRVCEEFEDGLSALVDALRRTMGSASPEFRRTADVITTNWTPRRPR
jgi:nucleoside phosphorylase